MEIKALGVDLGKNCFHLHGIDKRGKTVLQKKVSRERLPIIVANLPPLLNRDGSLCWSTFLGS
jgi:hypothetical protein